MMEEQSRDLSRWRPPAPPPALTLQGRYVRLTPLDVGHAAGLHAAFAGDDAAWRFMSYGPFPDVEAHARWIGEVAGREDPRFVVLEAAGESVPGGVASLLRPDPAHGVIELGHIRLAPAFRRSRAATEAIHLLADRAFAAGYRRLEWKCDARNAPSRRAAERYGFAFEGVFRQHMIVRGQNRDTAWFAITDRDWPEIRSAHRAWLDPDNFDAAGRQRTRLGALTEPARSRAEAEHSPP